MNKPCDETILRMDLKIALDDFDTIESVIKDHIIPISLSHDERLEPLLGIHPSFTLMNREYLSMKVLATRWLKSRDFVVDDRVEIGNGLYIDYYTEFDHEPGRLIIEIKRSSPSPENDKDAMICKKRKVINECSDSE